MGRRQLARKTVFSLLSLNWDKKKIKKETKISERTYFRILEEYKALPETEKEKLRHDALKEEDAKALFTDYPFVQKWTQRLQSEKVRSWKIRLSLCEKVWLLLQKKNPENWTSDDIKIRAIPELRKGKKSIFNYLIAIRSLRPDLKKDVGTKREKAQVNTSWKPKFEKLIENDRALLKAFLSHGSLLAQTLKNVHITVGSREGVNNYREYGQNRMAETEIGGILGMRWEKVNWNNRTIDVYETKTGGGFDWLNCPLDLFGDTCFKLVTQYWESCGKPKEGRIFQISAYKEASDKESLYGIYAEASDFVGIDINPHMARKIHASLCHEADIALEIVAGDRPHGLVGVGWEDLTTLKKFYLSFSKKKLESAKTQGRTIAL